MNIDGEKLLATLDREVWECVEKAKVMSGKGYYEKAAKLTQSASAYDLIRAAIRAGDYTTKDGQS